MKLPVLRDKPEGTVVEAVSCTEHDYCSSCTLFHKNGGRCEGCTTKHRKQMQPSMKWCYQECHSCTGYKATVTAICCRSPLKTMYLDAVTQNPDNWNEPSYEYTKRDVITFKNKAIFHFGQKLNAKNFVGDALDDLPVVATNMKVVAKPSGKGFVSDDLHDYLSLSKKTKLILTTMDIDDHLEAAWKEELYLEPEEFERVGLSYWMPLAFTAWGDTEARMHQYYQFCRTNLVTEKSKAHFVAAYYRGPGIRLDDLVLKALEKIPQLMFNCQVLGRASSDNMANALLDIRDWHRFAPAHIPFWFVGASTPTFFYNVRKILGERDAYYVSGKPLYMALYGQRMRKDGNERDLLPHEHPDKPTLVRENYNMFSKLVKKWDKRKEA